jgi:hypothetical protein
MKTLKERLFEIARDRGEQSPSNRYFEALLGLSSGRITQLFKPGASDKISARVTAKLEALGYSSNWVLEGKGSMRLSENTVERKLSPEEAQVLDDLSALLPEDAAVWRAQISAAAIKEKRRSEPDPPSLPKERHAG